MLRLEVQGPGSRVDGLGFRVYGQGFRVQGLGCRVPNREAASTSASRPGRPCEHVTIGQEPPFTLPHPTHPDVSTPDRAWQGARPHLNLETSTPNPPPDG